METEKINGISKDDVWGKFEDFKRQTNGMLVARGLPSNLSQEEKFEIQNNSVVTPLPDVCPVWGDVLPYKSVTVICDEKDASAVIGWLGYVHGGEYSDAKQLPNGKIALRSDYQAW